MLETWIIVAVLAGIALTANIAVCLYTLYLAKKTTRTQFMKGYTTALIEHVTPTMENETFKPECSD